MSPVVSSVVSEQAVPAAAPVFSAAGLARLSINQTTTVRWTIDECVREFSQLGLTGIGVTIRRLRDDGLVQAARAIRRSGLKVSTVGWVGGFTGLHGHRFDDAVDDVRAGIAEAGALGAAALVVVTGAQSGHIRPHARRLVVEGLSAVADQAAEANVRLALQPMHPVYAEEWSFLTGLDETLEIIDRCRHPAVALAFGTYHLWQEPRLVSRIAEIAPRVACVQLADWREPPRCDNDRLMPGDGPIPIGDIVAAFEDAGYRGQYEFEVWSRDLWKGSHRALIQECVERFSGLLPIA